MWQTDTHTKTDTDEQYTPATLVGVSNKHNKRLELELIIAAVCFLILVVSTTSEVNEVDHKEVRNKIMSTQNQARNIVSSIPNTD